MYGVEARQTRSRGYAVVGRVLYVVLECHGQLPHGAKHGASVGKGHAAARREYVAHSLALVVHGTGRYSVDECPYVRCHYGLPDIYYPLAVGHGRGGAGAACQKVHSGACRRRVDRRVGAAHAEAAEQLALHECAAHLVSGTIEYRAHYGIDRQKRMIVVRHQRLLRQMNP